MSGTQSNLDAAAADRKARLAKLASLKRKQPESDTTVAAPKDTAVDKDGASRSQTNIYLSGRNYDKEANAPKLGFDSTPDADQETVERQAARLTAAAAEQAAKDEAEAEKGIDLFKLQPKKPNWDLKRDLAEKMQIVDVRTQNAIARLVRERIESRKQEALKNNTTGTEDGGEEVGLDGSALVEGVHLREKEVEEEERKAKELEDDVS